MFICINNLQCIYSISDFYFPETINPNSQNNTFKIYGLGFDRNRGNIEIYNRWGEMVFSTTDLDKGWDGKINGEIADMGMYIYKALFYDQLNERHIRSGSILVIR